MKSVTGTGRLCAAAATPRGRGNSRANPGAIPYVPEAYADEPQPRPRPSDPYRRTPGGAAGRDGGGRPPARPIDEDDEPSGTSPAVWAAGIAALLILAAVAFIVFRLLSSPGTSRSPCGPCARTPSWSSAR